MQMNFSQLFQEITKTTFAVLQLMFHIIIISFKIGKTIGIT